MEQNQHIPEEEEEELSMLTSCQSSSHEEEKELIPESEADSDDGCVSNLVSQHVVGPIWRGSLHLSNQSFGTITGLVAHVSSLACSKVHEEAKLFPQVLSANLLQRSTVWPKSFKEFEPDHRSIGLYFFPETERVERAIDNLVDDMITRDLAITTMVENAELLIFPSTVLPIQYKRFQAKYYLWGVFRAKKKEDTSGIIKSSPSNTLRN